MQATIGGRAVSYFVEGQGTPVLLMHAFPLNQTMFEVQLRDFSRIAKVILFDVPGLGQSAPGPVGIDDQARIAAGLLDVLKIDKAIVGGVSMGGYAAFSFARIFPERLLGLLLADTRPAADTADARAGRQKSADFVLQNGSAELAKQLLPKFVGAAELADERIAGNVRQMIEAAPPKVVADLLSALGSRRDSTDLLSMIKVPTLVICGEEDAITTAAEAR
ncbi:MAG: alpha/beta hydrolase [Acidobacteria bacterium]|nr:alpha/beta hydrolase [Acidobacteriota bacterium]